MDIKQALNLLLSDRFLFKETLMSIEDKNRQLVPYIHNPIQRDIHLTSTGRDIYVKPAQVGFSSDTILDFLLDCVTVPGTTSVVISYDEFITGRLLRKAYSFYDIIKNKLPSVDELKHKSTNEMTFDKLGSSFFIGSARSFAFGRGEPIHNLLMDEFAFWQFEDAEAMFAAALNRVPTELNTRVRIGSTPNGQDNVFFDTYMAAKEGKAIGKSIFTAHCYFWFQHPEYCMKFDSPFVLPGDNSPLLTLAPDEEVLIKRFGTISDEEAFNKIRWRRYKIAEMESLRRGGGTRLLFQQEFPEDDASCFLKAGDMVHSPDQLTDMAARCFPASIHKLHTDIWEEPAKDGKYLVAIDPGVGITSESVATVWEFTEDLFKHVATLHGFYKGDEMATKSIELADYYNGAVIANEDALEFTFHIKGYHDLYYRKDIVSGKMTSSIGWATTPKTKPYMITEVNRSLSKIDTKDIRLIQQSRNIRWIKSNAGIERAMSVGADDFYMSMAIAICCRECIPIARGLVGIIPYPDY